MSRIIVRKTKKTIFDLEIDKKELSIARSIERALKSIKDSVNEAEVTEALKANISSYLKYTIDYNRIDELFKTEIKKSCEAGVTLGAVNEAKNLKKQVTKALKVDIVSEIIPEVPFTLDNVRVAGFINSRVQKIGALMINANMTTLETVVRLNFRNGYAPKQIANIIKNSIGLTERGAMAVNNLENSLRLAGKAESVIEKSINFYSNRLIKQRALNIARTEVMTAVNFGQTEIWKQSFEAGFVKEQDYLKEWNTAFDELVCPICEPLDGEQVEVSAEFSGGFQSPPAHNSCRCLKSLVYKGN